MTKRGKDGGRKGRKEGRGKEGEKGAETTPGVLEDIVPLSPRRSHSPNSCPLCLFSGGGKSHNPSY